MLSLYFLTNYKFLCHTVSTGSLYIEINIKLIKTDDLWHKELIQNQKYFGIF